MHLTASDSIDFLSDLSDQVVPRISSVAGQTADHLADLPAAVGAIARSSKARSRFGTVMSFVRRYPLAIVAVAVTVGAFSYWRTRKTDSTSRPIEFPKPEAVKADKPGSEREKSTSDGASLGLVAPTSS